MPSRRLTLFIAAVATVVALSSCSSESPSTAEAASTAESPSTSEPRVTSQVAPDDCGVASSGLESGSTRQSIAVADVERSYRLFVPDAGGDVAWPSPLIVDFHGAGSNSTQQSKLSEFETLAASEGVVVVTPEGLNSRWEVADIPLVAALLDTMEATGCIDLARIYTAGMSNGGFFSSQLACRLSDRIAAIATVTGIFHPADCAPARHVPIVHFHGTDDTIVPFEQIPGAIAQWAETYGCDPPASEQLTDLVERRSYQDCADARIDFYVIDEAGHTWPGSEESARLESRLGVTNLEISATDLAWEFFVQHPLTDPQ